MRKFSLVLGAVLCLSATPATVSANNKNKPTTTFAGAGQRSHFSFGGALKLKNSNTKVSGKFVIIAHPAAPGGDILSIVCTYHEFRSPTLQGTTLEFDGEGMCRVLAKTGEINKVAAKNHFKFVDNGATGDTIDVDANAGGFEIAIPNGELSFGDFTITAPQPS
jgi:hypothetical protein